MVEYDQENILKVVIPNINPIVCRQDAPKVFDHVASIYVLDPNYLRSARGLLDGNVKGYNIGVDKGIDLDTEFDFELIEYLMKKKIS